MHPGQSPCSVGIHCDPDRMCPVVNGVAELFLRLQVPNERLPPRRPHGSSPVLTHCHAVHQKACAHASLAQSATPSAHPTVSSGIETTVLTQWPCNAM
ncbi:unnamed protein product [Chondrus crispus]|uniref:Uncharacterized protein n=1 Tax=Chondrus crispus TaxID=2769 RepID=R7Q646_CHOCR|nr:unnamed protein product [Chondrus crispus]CDF33328.1 unnamed protein product [Chondrus crispus]|eukprot:XP_005713131.1 unnamed protein product [Chondrus crispus]